MLSVWMDGSQMDQAISDPTDLRTESKHAYREPDGDRDCILKRRRITHLKYSLDAVKIALCAGRYSPCTMNDMSEDFLSRSRRPIRFARLQECSIATLSSIAQLALLTIRDETTHDDSPTLDGELGLGNACDSIK